MNFQDQLQYNLSPGPHHESDAEPINLPKPLPVRLIAFYLPQFHPVPENDAWWGKGFTEWTNVTKAVPQFEGHYQPHLPTALGFYDLRNFDVMQEQWTLASRHGIQGFCFHYYWFSGRKILERPLQNLLDNPTLSIPFCVNWANHNWTRTWDNSERDVLLEQSYSAADDLAFIDDIIPLLQDPRYIRIGDRPLIMIYQPELFPDLRATLERWRHRVRERGLPNPYLVMPLAFGNDDPRPLGFDAVVGFPPHRFGAEIRNERGQPKGYSPLFTGDVIDYDRLAAAASAFDPTDFTIFHGVCPEWDNAARRPNRGLTFRGSTPAVYGDWLFSACMKVMRRNSEPERLVFINAWNEWAEGAHLEPDRHHGFAYLRETARALVRAAKPHPVHTSTGLPPTAILTGTKRRQARKLRVLTHQFRHKLALLAEGLASAIRPSG